MLYCFLKVEIDGVPQDQQLPFRRTDVDSKPVPLPITLIIEASFLIFLLNRRRVEECRHFAIANDLGVGTLERCHFDCEVYLLGGGRLDPIAH